MALVFILLVVYQVKHWLCDYPLQRPWMLGKFKSKAMDWVPPLAAHAAVHGIGTYVIATLLMPASREYGLFLALIDFAVHFTMDRIKASEKLMGRWKPLSAAEYMNHQSQIRDGYLVDRANQKLRGNRLFWHALGIDQMVHHLTHYYIIWALVH